MNIVNIANSCINLKLMLIIIPKLNMTSYDASKSFQPIVLLNTVGKLIKKVISNKIQVHSIASNFIHLNQMGGIK